MVRGGRLTKYKGKIVSLAPLLGQLTGFILPMALSAVLMIAGSITMTGNTAARARTITGGAVTGIWTGSGPATGGDTTQTPTPEVPNGKLTVTTNSGLVLTLLLLAEMP